MHCHPVRVLMAREMRDGLSREQSDVLERHLRRCAACRGERARQATLSAHLTPERLPGHAGEPPREAIRRRLEAGTTAPARHRRAGMAAATVMAAALICAAIALLIHAQRPPRQPERIVRVPPVAPAPKRGPVRIVSVEGDAVSISTRHRQDRGAASGAPTTSHTPPSATPRSSGMVVQAPDERPSRRFVIGRRRHRALARRDLFADGRAPERALPASSRGLRPVAGITAVRDQSDLQRQYVAVRGQGDLQGRYVLIATIRDRSRPGVDLVRAYAVVADRGAREGRTARQYVIGSIAIKPPSTQTAMREDGEREIRAW